jgi:predicted Rossmann fold nucleotide-binding protein DprA/Smf involved in DNA uptake
VRQRKMAEESTQVLGQELLEEWQKQVGSLRDENVELKKSLEKAQQKARRREKELREKAQETEIEREAEWEASQVGMCVCYVCVCL